jgi:hypothetical protein
LRVRYDAQMLNVGKWTDKTIWFPFTYLVERPGNSRFREAEMREGKPIHLSIRRIQCPCCGRHMRLTKIEASFQSLPEIASYECKCGFSYEQTDRARASG